MEYWDIARKPVIELTFVKLDTGLYHPFYNINHLHQTLTFLFRQFPQQLDLPRVALVLVRRFQAHRQL